MVISISITLVVEYHFRIYKYREYFLKVARFIWSLKSRSDEPFFYKLNGSKIEVNIKNVNTEKSRIRKLHFSCTKFSSNPMFTVKEMNTEMNNWTQKSKFSHFYRIHTPPFQKPSKFFCKSGHFYAKSA